MQNYRLKKNVFDIGNDYNNDASYNHDYANESDTKHGDNENCRHNNNVQV